MIIKNKIFLYREIKESENFQNKNILFYQYIKKNYSLTSEEQKIWKEILHSNTYDVIHNYSKYNSFLLMGDVQSGKTNSLIHIAINLLIENKVDVIIYLSGGANDLLDQNQGRFFEAFREIFPEIKVVINNGINDELMDFELRNKTKIIVNSLKIKQRMEEIYTFILTFKNKRFLIVDDECDSFSSGPEIKKIFQSIQDLSNTKFLSISATPFINLYSKIINYDYFKVLNNWPGYTGFDDFDNNIKVVSIKRLAIIDGYLSWLYLTASKNLKNSQILFNMNHLNYTQEELYKGIKRFISYYSKIKDFIIYVKDMLTDYELTDVILTNMFHIHMSMLKDKIKLINSSFSENTHTNEGLEMIIGGYKLSRGITYQNLIVEVMFNASKKINVSTLIQKARWCGYRCENMSIIKIILNENVVSAIEECKEMIKLTKKYDLNYNNYKSLFLDEGFKFITIN